MKKILTSFTLTLLCYTILIGQVGILDPTFAVDGIFRSNTDGQDSGADVVTQPDGKVLALFSGSFGQGFSFDFGVVRLNLNGSIDSTFAENGYFHYVNPLGSDLSYHMELLDDGSILLAGCFTEQAANPEWMMIKLTSEGALDSSFGIAGVVVFSIDSSEDYIRSLAIAEDGKIYAGGYSHTPGFNYRRLVVGRFNSDGSIDTTYGDDGIFMWKDNQTANYLSSIHLNADGSLYVGGTTRPSSSDRPTVFKILPDGAGLDTSFGTDGESLAPVEGRAGKMAVHSNGNLLLSSPTTIGGGVDLAVIAFDANGVIDSEFGADGVFTADANVVDYGLDVIVQSDGKIVVSGESNEGAFMGSSYISARCDADGVLDTSWGGTGVQVYEMADSGIGWARAIYFDPNNGSIYLAGTASFAGTLNDLVIMRLGNLVDADNDGFYLGMDDCDDGDASINPDGIEIPNNGIDEDCDGEDLVLIRTNEVALANEFNVYPNPTNSLVVIEYSEQVVAPYLIELSDLTGKRYQEINPNESFKKITIDLSNVPSGVYYLGIHTENGAAIKKVIKQ